MLGRDAADGSLEDWREVAFEIEEAQLLSIVAGCRDVLAAAGLPEHAPVVAAGIGMDVAASIATRLDRRSIAFGALVDAAPECRLAASHSAPSVAVAMLLQGQARRV
jgi:hypothetical protein